MKPSKPKKKIDKELKVEYIWVAKHKGSLVTSDSLVILEDQAHDKAVFSKIPFLSNPSDLRLIKPVEEERKSVIAWAVCFVLNKKCLSDDIPTFETRAKAKQYIKELHKKIGGFEEDHHILKVRITPINTTKQ